MRKRILFILVLFIVIISVNAISATNINNTISDNVLNQESEDIQVVSEIEFDENQNSLSNVINPDIIYVGQNDAEDGGNGSYENPFSSLKFACDYVSGQDTVEINMLNGTYYVGSELKFDTNNLIINGINGNVIIKNELTTRSKQAIELLSPSSNCTINNIIFDGSNWTLTFNKNAFFTPFKGDANLVEYNNCTFIGGPKMKLYGASEFNLKMINCTIENFNNQFIFSSNFYNGDNPKSTDYRFVYFENCIFLDNKVNKIASAISINKSVNMDGMWFGENEIPGYLLELTAYTPQNTYDNPMDIPITKYAIFNVTEKYLGNNQYEIIGTLCWNGTNDTVGDAFAPRTVALTSTTGNISSNATLENGIFRAVYTSNSSDNKVTATLDYQPIELNFANVDFQVDAPCIYYGDDQNITVTLPQAMNATISITVNNKTYEVKTNNISTTYKIDDVILTEGKYDVNVTIEALVNEVHIHGINSTQLIVSKVSDYTFNPIAPSQEVRAGYWVEISIELPDDASGVITISVEDGNASSYLVNGSLDVSVLISKVGDNKIIINYTDDNKYASDYREVHITAYNETPMIEITIPTDVKVGDSVDIGITLPDDATGIVLATVGENKYWGELIDGETTIKVPNVSENVTVTVKYLGDGRYVDSTANATLEVTEKADANIKIEIPDDIKVGDTIVINVTADSDAVLEVLINGEAQKVIDGGVTYTIDAADTYDVVVRANETAEYKFDVEMETFDASKLDSTVTVIVTDAKVGETATVSVNVTVGATGIVLVGVGDEIYAVDLADGNTIEMALDEAGNYTVVATYLGNDRYYGSLSNLATLKITEKADANIKIEIPANAKVGDIIIINITADSDADLRVIINDVDQTINNGTVTYTVDKATLYTVVVIANETADYKEDVEVELFEATKADATVTITLPENITAGEDMVIGVATNSDAKVTVLIDGEQQEVVAGNVTITAIAGLHDIIAYVNATEAYNAAIAFESYNADKKVATLNIAGNNVIVGEKSTINVNITENATGFVIISVDDETFYMTEFTHTNTASIDVLFDKAGNHTVSATYLGDQIYDIAYSDEITIDVSEKEVVDANITSPVDFKIGEEANVTVSIPDATGNVSVIVDGIETVVPLDENGTAVVPVNVTGGEHSIVVVYSGDKDHAPVVKTATFYAEELDSEFTNLTVSDDLVVTGVLVNSLGNPIANATIAYVVGSKSGNLTTGTDGSFTIAGESNAVLSVDYAGNDYIVGSNFTIKFGDLESARLASEFNVTEGISIKTYAVDSKAGEVGQTTSFRLTDSNGNPIVNATVKFAYKTVILNRTTDENGIVFIGINTQIAQEALCALSYLGDEKHNATFVAFSFDIQKKPITISAAAKSYKASAKTKKYTVTLKTEKCNSRDGKVYLSAGKKVTLKLNGKTYTAKTDKNGKATFSLKITKKGKQTAKISFAGDKTYASASKSVKITIK